MALAVSARAPSATLATGISRSKRPAPSRAPCAAAGRPGRVLAVAPRAFYSGAGPSDSARRAMEEIVREMARASAAGRAGFAPFPGGGVWGGVWGGSGCDPAAAGGGAVGGREGAAAGPGLRLPIDLVKEPEAYTVVADVPGVTKDRLSIKLNARTPDAPAALVIRGARQDGGGGAEAMLRERRRGEFERRVPLPDDAATVGITARVRDGVLTVRVPRVAPQPREADSDIPIE